YVLLRLTQRHRQLLQHLNRQPDARRGEELGLHLIDHVCTRTGVIDRFKTFKNSQFAQPLVRVLRSLRRLRRNTLHQAAHPAVRRADDDLQRHRLFLHLRRHRTLHAVPQE
ncbi:MAG: hypothetical protein MZV63_46355, partial [Marinilabiliales bacterium]|nr:hypothetical protein [Marinilabiliales bacterium]